MANTTESHWNTVYGTKAVDQVSWFEPHARTSLEFIRAAGVALDAPIIDVGGGASPLVTDLLADGYRDLTVLDVSSAALEIVRERIGPAEGKVTFIHQDVRAFKAQRQYALWHDRAVFHFLVDRADRDLYVQALRASLLPEGNVVIATFGPSGPERCSGLAVQRYDSSSLAEQLGPEFTLVASTLVTHRTPKETPQEFLWCRFRRSRPDAAKSS